MSEDMTSDLITGVDIGGTGIKAAPVHIATGELATDRIRMPTPSPATPSCSGRWPSSEFGTSTPSTYRALPIPVPRVIMATTPAWPRPEPKRTSAIPAASASFITATGRPVTLEKKSTASTPIQVRSMCDAVSMTLPRTTAGTARPTGPPVSMRSSTSPTTWATACGVAGDGVGTRIRSAASFPVAMSTGAALIPVPPMSTPTTRPGAISSFNPCLFPGSPGRR